MKSMTSILVGICGIALISSTASATTFIKTSADDIQPHTDPQWVTFKVKDNNGKIHVFRERTRVIPKGQYKPVMLKHGQLTSADGPISCPAPTQNKSMQLGDNGVPVMNQGPWGSCVTFASAFAVNALYGLANSPEGPYGEPLGLVSPTCSLQYARTLYKDDSSADAGGWWGYVTTNNNPALDLLRDHGYWSRESQLRYQCGGLSRYPDQLSPENDGTQAPYVDGQISPAMTREIWETHKSTFPGDGLTYAHLPLPCAVARIKNAIDQGYRVVISANLVSYIKDGYFYANAGQSGRYQSDNDTFVLNTDPNTSLIHSIVNHYSLALSEHEMVITGYDDNACAVSDKADTSGKPFKQCGLFTLRNSYGPDVGDNGKLYMSYTYFQGGDDPRGLVDVMPTLSASSDVVGDKSDFPETQQGKNFCPDCKPF